MKPLGNFLDRFRTVLAPPGPATGRVTPPADVDSRLRGELAPLFAILDEFERDASALVEDAERDARNIVAEAESGAAEAVADAEDGAPEARSRAATTRTRRIALELEAVEETARQEAAQIESIEPAAVTALVSRVLACVGACVGESR